MNLTNLQQKLIRAARSQPADERVPYAFEKRIMAHVKGRKNRKDQAGLDLLAVWGRGLWRTAISCVALVAVLTVTVFLLPATATAENSPDLSQDFENALLASVNQAETALP